MKIRSSAAAVVLGAAVAVVPLAALTASPAAADNCEPTEPVLRPVLGQAYEERVLDDRDNPACYVLRGYVYPRICDDPRTLLAGQQNPGCVNTLNPDPNEPVVIAPFAPDAGRIVCTSSNFVFVTIGAGGGTCSS